MSQEDTFVLPIKDYERIYRVITSILQNENYSPTGACLFYSIAGATILSEHYGISALPACGEAIIKLTDDHSLIYGKPHGNGITADKEFFHCWVQTKAGIIDFTAPFYGKILQIGYKDVQIPKKMMQRTLSQLKTTEKDVLKIGDAYYHEYSILSTDLLSPIYGDNIFRYLFDQCVEWYKRPPENIRKSHRVMDKRGELAKLNLDNTHITESW